MTQTIEKRENGRADAQSTMQKPPVVSAQAWEAARQEMLVKEKAHTRARDALAAERRRMPWTAVTKNYVFEGSDGKASLLDLFAGRRQLIVYRAFYEPGVHGWPDHGCRGCSMVADQVAHLSHLNARDTTLVFASRAPQADIARLKARMGWTMPWYTITDSFDADFDVASGTATMSSSATAKSCFAPTSSTAAATNRWVAPGTISTSPRSADRKCGRIRRPDIRRPRPTSGGTGTTATLKALPPTKDGSKYRMPARPRCAPPTRARSHEHRRPLR